MSLSRLARLIGRAGRVAEPAPTAPVASPTPSALVGSLPMRHVDAGSCNGCEIEIANTFGPVYDGERYGCRLVASPRHADALIVTGVVTRNMRDPLQKTDEATPRPRVVVAVGDCAIDCGAFKGGFGVAGSVSDFVDVDISVPGCPPEPEAIIAALRQVTGR